jgi:RNA polymerase sigma-70 factor (ECF subfamily)
MTVEPALRNELLAFIPNLRAFAYSLTYNWDQTDDLVQETITRAWAKIDHFERGTNLHAWLLTILRNLHYTDHRKRKHEVEDPDGSYTARLKTHADQLSRLDFEDLRKALAQLTPTQREALLLVTAEDLPYEEAAAICGVALGTIKSRVYRARETLAQILDISGIDDLGPDKVSRAATQY